MKNINIAQEMKRLLEPHRQGIKARLFVSREDGITVYDSIQNDTTAAVSALVSGVWQASEALMGMVDSQRNVMEFRLGFDTSAQGIYLFPFALAGKRYFLGAIYQECLNPGQLKRQVSQLKIELDREFSQSVEVTSKQDSSREGFLFQNISDEEIDRLFSIGGA
jgi:hypothetical protein